MLGISFVRRELKRNRKMCSRKEGEDSSDKKSLRILLLEDDAIVVRTLTG